jgi:putative ABC transport system ATP-binding protein
LGERLYHRPNRLSGGRQQRVATIPVPAKDPAPLPADKPTGHLDSTSGRDVFTLRRGLNWTTGQAFLLVTHDLGFALETDRVPYPVEGRLV